ncbi:response regulator receiver domain containing protein [Acanthamoeba castellanii str. Neff]|uniref:Response regulator receiver domain containing protein n=1 Tax=Acanthamoeba castellanii (strain ATCC 30010 / Neff) TaxID=1257118 RepID=L8HB07_ACACF|nr:response regulator receiver domain containing protein [Acanthamoeba castellanii str. Neff]ELR22390.1 response regulator receiver domain containing protein [Acanthamoeba castellanii str. Neff]
MNNNNNHQGIDYEKEVGDEDTHLAFVLPAGYAESHSAEDIRKFVMVQIMALVLATLHLTLLGLGTLSTFSLAAVLPLEIVALYLLRVKHDFIRAALLLTSVINFTTLFACLHYGLVPEIYVWLGWVPKILSFTMGVEGGLIGLALVLVEGAVLFLLGSTRSSGIQVEEPARALTVNAYLLCFGLTACVHEYCRGRALHRLRVALGEVKRANDELRAAAEAKSIFLATTSHELRTPLHGILALCDSLIERMPPRQAGRKTVKTISQCGRHLLGLLNNILDFEKACSDTFSIECIPFSIAREAEKVCATFAAMMKGKQITLEKYFNPQASHYMGDPLRFRQIVCNLVSNACKFTPSGGTIRVSITSQPTGAVRVEVADTGIGIAPPEQARLFQNYVQGDNSITRLYGGKRVLVVDDNPVNRKVCVALLRRFGCVTRVVADDDHFDAILMDFLMPVLGTHDTHDTHGTRHYTQPNILGVADGLQATTRIRQDEAKHGCRPVPIIGLTATATAEATARAHEAGMNDVLTKPFDHDQLAAALSRWVVARPE